MSQGYICKCCGLHNDQVPMNYGADDPIYVTSMNEAERATRVQMNERLCIIDNEHYFVRGVIQIPVIDSDEMFSWGVWTTMSEENIGKMVNNWDTPGREHIVEPAFGYLSTRIPVYDDTLNLILRTRTMPIGIMPVLELKPVNHPLVLDQINGITMARVHEIAKTLLPS